MTKASFNAKDAKRTQSSQIFLRSLRCFASFALKYDLSISS